MSSSPLNADRVLWDLQDAVGLSPHNEIVIRHDLSTGQKFHFNVLSVERDAQTGRISIVTNGVVREDLKT